MGHLRHWWQHLTGKKDEKKTAPPAETRPARTRPAAEGLSLAEGEQPRRRSRLREAGFDPYANDAGFGKPHSWERIDRK
jgi:hypothetical protein